MNVLGSDDRTCVSCDKINKGLSRDNEICLEIHSVDSLSTSDDVDLIYANNM